MILNFHSEGSSKPSLLPSLHFFVSLGQQSQPEFNKLSNGMCWRTSWVRAQEQASFTGTGLVCFAQAFVWDLDVINDFSGLQHGTLCHNCMAAMLDSLEDPVDLQADH